MASQAARLRVTMLRLIFILGCWLGSQQTVWAKQVAITVDDTDPSIIYLPASAWQASSDVPGLGALNNSFHNGTHVAPSADPDDFAQTSNDPDDPDEGQKGDKGSKGGKGSGHTRRFWRRELSERLDPDDAGFSDTPVTVQFNFNGSAVSLFAIEPLATTTTPLTSMNLSFTLDNQELGLSRSFTHSGTPGGSGFKSNSSVFSQQNMEDGPHTLLVTVQPGSVFLFDYMVYTATQEDDTGGTTIDVSSTTDSGPLASSSSAPTHSPSPTVDPRVQKHNIATFGGAVGGSVGVLSIFAMGLAFSIIRRRQKAAKRERMDQESLHTNASEDTPAMSGPRPFIPRYFPGTVVPTEPPTYTDSVSPGLSTANHIQAPLLSSLSPEYRSVPLPLSGDTSDYADIPPPMTLDDGVIIPGIAPPPFPEAIATPPPAVLSNVLPPSGPSGSDSPDESEPRSHEEETVGTPVPVSVSIPEAAALFPSRSQSRASSHSREHVDAGS